MDAGANSLLVTPPEPATDRFIVDGHGLVPSTRIRMVDATGKILVDSKPVATVTDISTGRLGTGTVLCVCFREKLRRCLR